MLHLNALAFRTTSIGCRCQRIRAWAAVQAQPQSTLNPPTVPGCCAGRTRRRQPGRPGHGRQPGQQRQRDLPGRLGLHLAGAPAAAGLIWPAGGGPWHAGRPGRREQQAGGFAPLLCPYSRATVYLWVRCGLVHKQEQAEIMHGEIMQLVVSLLHVQQAHGRRAAAFMPPSRRRRR